MATTQTTDVTWDQSAYEQLAYFPLRAGTFYDQFATVKPTRQSMPGAAVIFDFPGDLSATVTWPASPCSRSSARRRYSLRDKPTRRARASMAATRS